ncbi:hypothetical protein [Lysinibacillus sp. JNUCC 51]|uniref:hypothetical protein n=1 Tax=Lysinibacillus sp. JNUCC-51 TaxID=2792479 RepID=UPI00193579E6|nr:hypothetical protein JNUCC51_04480 [Lysinibacillus sp. JNUCC-51]
MYAYTAFFKMSDSRESDGKKVHGEGKRSKRRKEGSWRRMKESKRRKEGPWRRKEVEAKERRSRTTDERVEAKERRSRVTERGRSDGKKVQNDG